MDVYNDFLYDMAFCVLATFISKYQSVTEHGGDGDVNCELCGP